jgi:hypothetical protein
MSKYLNSDKGKLSRYNSNLKYSRRIKSLTVYFTSTDDLEFYRLVVALAALADMSTSSYIKKCLIDRVMIEAVSSESLTESAEKL